ncbi:ABC transporter substrate-binding protein [Nocardia sp. NBC_01730]|uniref:ABC transporter substrate-binding protein n=1 Tax=Nocardia sp. NBC_01730 TaxID=2975998 RepID=UPI002E12B47E|nr:ABC transporter substrate-binding protein [Nocardia sp. NBC_01730]
MGFTSNRRRLFRIVAAPLAFGLMLTGACSTSAPAATPGITRAPCPQAIHKDKGCIYLGVLSDLNNGPFAPLGRSMQDGQLAFWNEVNKKGGIGGYEIDIATYTRDTAYDPRKHVTEFENVAPHVLALAMSFGTAQTLAVLHDMDEANLVTAAGTLWSGWQYRSTDHDLVLDGGFSYCTEAVLGLDWFAQNHYQPRTLGVVAYRGNYGGDYASGALKWALDNGATIASRIDTGPNSEVGNQDFPVAEIMANPPDLVLLATGPAETAEIVSKLAKDGYTGRFLGSTPTWNSALLKTPAAQALTTLYNYTSPFDGWDGNSIGAQRARNAAPSEPTNFGYNLGWGFSYPLKTLLTKAAESGALDRPTLRKMLDGLTVDSEGMAATQIYGRDEPDVTVQRAMVNVPDPSTSLGSHTVVADYQSPTLKRIAIHEPCTR